MNEVSRILKVFLIINLMKYFRNGHAISRGKSGMVGEPHAIILELIQIFKKESFFSKMRNYLIYYDPKRMPRLRNCDKRLRFLGSKISKERYLCFTLRVYVRL